MDQETSPQESEPGSMNSMPAPRSYQQEMLEKSLKSNIIIALDTGSGKTLIAILRIKHEMEREPTKISWFFAPTVALCEQQKAVIKAYLPVSVGLISGSLEPDQWRNASLWESVLRTHRIMVSTPQVFLDALRHGYIIMGRDISLLIFDEAHHAVDNHPYNRIMKEFYLELPPRPDSASGFGFNAVVRPSVLGLTASPIYGGNVIKAFQTIESNLDSTICAPLRHRQELTKFVHRPEFRHVMYNGLDPDNPPFSTNLAALDTIVATMDIEKDPYVKSLRVQLSKATRGSTEYHRLDQKLSKVIMKEDSFTHKGLRDFARTADEICVDLGPWAADWYIWQVVEKAKKAANPYNNMMSNWKNQEKSYLLGFLDQLVLSPVSYHPDDIVDDCSHKFRSLTSLLLYEKWETELQDESYSGLLFVQRRDTVLALSELLSRHPQTKDLFQVGVLLGNSDNPFRHSFLDITRSLLQQPQEDTIADFKIGEKNLLVSTSVAEEGIDIQACGSVIRWDPPTNMASWAQSRGRARRQRSTFTLMFETGSSQQHDVSKWEKLEREMVALYNDPQREVESFTVLGDDEDDDDDVNNPLSFRVETTGALLTLHSAVSHLSHFCAVIPNTVHVDNRPLYDIDPPEFQEGWHSFDSRAPNAYDLYAGPWGSKVTLPRSLPLPMREFCAEKIYKSRISAHRHAAIFAYKALYDAGLVNDNLLPIMSIVEPHLEDDIKALLLDVEKRSSTAKVSIQMDPWIAETLTDPWWISELVIDGLPPLRLFTISEPIQFSVADGPLLYRPYQKPVQVTLRTIGRVSTEDESIARAREYTRRIFWYLNGSRMVWDKLDFAYLILPMDSHIDPTWDSRRSTISAKYAVNSHVDDGFLDAAAFGEEFGYPDDIVFVRKAGQFGKLYRFARWRYEPLSEEELVDFKAEYSHLDIVDVPYPLLVVQQIPPRTNFLIPRPQPDDPPAQVHSINLLPSSAMVALVSSIDADYAFFLPSILRNLTMMLTVNSLRKELFTNSPLSSLPNHLMLTAMTAPVSGENTNYQRLETLGDTVLKFVVSLQLLVEYPLWHEGYLTKKKDHSVSNVRLAKEDIAKGLYRWIIRDRMVGKKWKPKYLTEPVSPEPKALSTEDQTVRDSTQGKKKRPKKQQELSTKVLADVVESLIGAAYLHGGFELGYECAKYFGLGIKWEPIPIRITQVYSRIEADPENLPLQLSQVETMLGYTFTRKLFLIEALTHASYQQDLNTVSYERMEFLGDSVTDMIVTDYLYHAPGKKYSPGHIHLRRSAVVNGHFLAYLCLRAHLEIDAAMPSRTSEGRFMLNPDSQEVYLWQCLLHSSPRVLEDQFNTFTRYRLRHAEIEESLTQGPIFPWASLTRLQAPKFFSDMVESLVGAVFLDSGGDINAALGVLIHLGLMKVLERIVEQDLDVLHPVSRLSLWADKHEKSIEYKFVKEKGNISCLVLVDDKEEARVTDKYRGTASQEEVKFAAAEMAITAFGLRDVNMNYTLMKGRRKKPNLKKAKKVKVTYTQDLQG